MDYRTEDLSQYLSAQRKPKQPQAKVRNLHQELTPYNPNWREENKLESIAKYAKLNSTTVFPSDSRYSR